MGRDAVNIVGVGFVVLSLVACSAIEAAAQAAPARPKSPVKRWSVAVGLSGPKSGDARQFEDAMRSANFDDPSPGLFGPPIAHPFSDGGRLSKEYEVTYRRNDRVAFGLVMDRVGLGTTAGYQEPFLYLFLSSKVTVLAPVASLLLGEHLRVGAGPLVGWTEVSTENQGNIQRADTSVKGGALVSATVESSPRRRVYVALTGSYRWLPTVTVGPFTTEAFDRSATLPAMKANLSHFNIGASLGVRF